MHRSLVIGIFICCISSLWAQSLQVLPTPSTGAGIQTPRTDTWTAFHNPASLLQDSMVEVAAQYENRYLLSSLNVAMVEVGYGNRWVNVGVGYSFFGFSKYQEMLVGLSLSRRIGPVGIGVGVDYALVYSGMVTGYRGVVFPQIGLTYVPCTALTIGFHTLNPFRQCISLGEDRTHDVPALYSLGTDYRFASHCRWTVQGDWCPNSYWQVATAVEWQAIPELLIHVGMVYRRRLMGTMGLAWQFDQLKLDMGVQVDPRLGVIPQLRIGYRVKCAK